MSKSALFPYGITLREDGVFDTFPAAEVGFLTKEDEWLTLFLLIDSGATISALPKGDAVFFNLSLKKGKRVDIAGVSGKSLTGWQHNVTIRLGEEKLTIPIAFLNNEHAPRILGRAGIFPKYLVIFEEYNRRTVFLGSNTNTAKSVSKVLDKIAG